MKEKMQLLVNLETFASEIVHVHQMWLNGMLTTSEEFADLMKKATAGKNREIAGWKATLLAGSIARGITEENVSEELKSCTKIIMGISF